MLQHANLAVAPPPPEHDEPPHQPSVVGDALLALADPSVESRVSLIGPNTLELFCALVRRGSADVSATRVSDWPHPATADVAIIPGIASPDCLVRAIAHARRILSPLGTIALHVAADPADALPQQVGRLLLLHGFTAIRVVRLSGETLIRAELPLFGRLACA